MTVSVLQHGLGDERQPNRVVVIGAEGFVGRAAVERLRAGGADVIGLARRDVDLLKPDAVDRLAALLRDGDVVVAAAAIAPCKTAAMLRDNMVLVAAMLGAMSRIALAHVVNISSDAVYADLPEKLTETSWTAPGSVHGAMHLAREMMFRAEIRAPLAILRPTLIYGAADPHDGYGPNRFRRQAQRGDDIMLFGEGEERRDHVSIEDVAEIIARVVGRRSRGVLNIATGRVVSFHDLATLAASLSGKQIAVGGSPRSGPMPHNGWRAFDIGACTAAFPDFSFMPVEQGMARAQIGEFPAAH